MIILLASECVSGSELPNFGNPVLMNLAILGAWIFFLIDFRVSGSTYTTKAALQV